MDAYSSSCLLVCGRNSFSGSITDASGLLPLPVNDIICLCVLMKSRMPERAALPVEAGMGEAERETAGEAFCFCCSMSSNSRPLAAALCLFISRRRCWILLTERSGDSSCSTQSWLVLSIRKLVTGAPLWQNNATTRVWKLK